MPFITKTIKDVIPFLDNEDLVIIPTETVYGLGCNALSKNATDKVFKTKKRPESNPLIMHVGKIEQIGHYGVIKHDYIHTIIDKLMPGSITLVLEAQDFVPEHAKTKSNSIAIRIPNHTKALELLRDIDYPIAAPSANFYSKLSPTSVNELDSSLIRKVGAILDGGPCSIGIESTILDCRENIPKIIRPGIISATLLKQITGKKVQYVENQLETMPGCSRVHYTTKAKIKIVRQLEPGQPGLTRLNPQNSLQILMPFNALGYAQMLYKALHYLDSIKLPVIYVESPPEGEEEWKPIWNRLLRAASEKESETL